MRKLTGKRSFVGAAAFVSMGIAVTSMTPARANVVLNGDFEAVSLPGVSQQINIQAPGQAVPMTVNNWTLGTGPNGIATASYLFQPGTADTSGALASSGGNFILYGPGNGVNNGLTPTSPAGGNFIAFDAGQFPGTATVISPENRTLSQTISNLSVGTPYDLTFYYAGAQEEGFVGATTETFTASLGDQSYTAPTLSNPTAGFTGWRQASTVFIPTSVTEVLSFVAQGTPVGLPPTALLDGVSLTAVSPVPEPASWSIIAAGFGLLGGTIAYRRRSRSAMTLRT